MAGWSVYVLRCRDGSHYTGIATDVRRRLREHEHGPRGAKYLRGRGPLQLVYAREVGDRSVAARIEHSIKRLTKTEKENLRQLPARIEGLLREIRDSAVS